MDRIRGMIIAFFVKNPHRTARLNYFTMDSDGGVYGWFAESPPRKNLQDKERNIQESEWVHDDPAARSELLFLYKYDTRGLWSEYVDAMEYADYFTEES